MFANSMYNSRDVSMKRHRHEHGGHSHGRRHVRHRTTVLAHFIRFLFDLERELKEELFRVVVPLSPELVVGLVHFAAGYLERDRFVRLSSEQ